MKTMRWVPIIFALGCCLMIGHVLAQEDMVVVDNSVFDNPTRPSARFEHDSHNEASEIDDCTVCHHVYEDGVRSEDESSEDLRCIDCHDGSKDGPEYGLRKAYHENCKGCHLEQKAGPILCGECHRNE